MESLRLDYTNIEELPDHFPKGLRVLCCSQTRINRVPSLPEGLEVLICCYVKQLTSIGTLPSTLLQLDIWGSPIERCPVLPRGLKTLDCSRTKITVLPMLPPTLLELRISETGIKYLPELSQGLTNLNISNTAISQIPDLPLFLANLCIAGTKISVLPKKLPPYLRTFSYDKTRIGDLPILPDSLEMISLLFTKTTRLPNIPENLASMFCSMDFLESFDVLPKSLTYVGCACLAEKGQKRLRYDSSCFDCFDCFAANEKLDYGDAFPLWRTMRVQKRITERASRLKEELVRRCFEREYTG